ncbi:MAG TPA: hypothetical protein DE179_12960 [Oceanospirillaceae bacterium]|nr:hypothetical protein [Oceanospirillaceae bacterium]
MSSTQLSRAQVFCLCALVCLASSSIDITIPAVPGIAEQFQVSQGQGQLLIATYLMGFALAQLPVGLLSDRYGRLPILFTGLGCYLVSSWLASQATSFDSLLWARFAQGIAGTTGAVIARAIVRDCSEGIELAKLSAMLVTSLAVATLAAPLVGSFILEFASWPSIFFANMTFATLLIVCFALLFKETSSQATRHKSRAQHLYQQLHQSAASFMTTRQSLWAASLVGCAFLGYMAIVGSLATVVVDVYDMSSTMVGWSFAAAACFYILSSTFNRLTVSRYGPWQLLQWGMLFTLFGTPLLVWALIAEQPSFGLIWLALIPFLTGLGLVLANGTAIALQPMGHMAGFAAAMLGTGQIACGALGSYLAAQFYAGSAHAMLGMVAVASVILLVTYWWGKGKGTN